MKAFYAHVDNISGFIWGGTWNGEQVLPLGFLAVLLLGTGVFFMLRLGFLPIRRLFPAIGEAWRGRKAQGEGGSITPWQALSTALSGQVGTGNLAGVATAITLGGPGAIFWMWMTALLGMACAFAESSLSVRFRETHPETGRVHGGPMYYIKNGLNKGRSKFGGLWGWLAILFCLGTIFSAIATGGMIQANSIAQAAGETARTMGSDLEPWMVGLVLAGLTFAVIIGGIKSIGSVAGKVVPTMAGLYVICAMAVIILHIQYVPDAFGLIFSNAFGLEQAAGGAAGYGVLQAVRYGVARGLFSNEAGQGSAPMAHAAASTANPVMQAEIAMIGVFIDTIVICSMTALVLLTVPGDFKRNEAREVAEICVASGHMTIPAGEALTDIFPSAYDEGRAAIIAERGPEARSLLEACAASGGEVSETALAAANADIVKDVRFAWQTDAEASAITTRAYAAGIPGGQWIVAVSLFLFAFTTILGWSYYAETAASYLFGERAIVPMRYVWVLIVFLGALTKNTDGLWRLGDIANASMALPNLITILLLSGTVVALVKEYGRK
ncbi:MAG TPA: sodium:alanine symporter family protein [Parvularculaceae bacterium]|nr:sodium:alanine symporter family protein [Parvularculaceae bacterium]